MRVLAVANQKGGCGKTTTTVSLAACLAFIGKKVLVVDLDSQGHAGLGLGCAVDELDRTLYDVLSPRAVPRMTLDEVTVEISPNLHLIPADLTLSALEQELGGLAGRESVLFEAFKLLEREYDFILIDCAPGLGILSFNALKVADEVLVPVETSLYSVHGLSRFIETVRLAEDEFDKEYLFHALIANYDGRTRTARRYLKEIRDYLEDIALTTIIRRNIRLSDAATVGKPITDFDRNSTGFADYMACTTELIERGLMAGDSASRRAATAVSIESLDPATIADRVAEEEIGDSTIGDREIDDHEIAAGENVVEIQAEPNGESDRAEVHSIEADAALQPGDPEFDPPTESDDPAESISAEVIPLGSEADRAAGETLAEIVEASEDTPVEEVSFSASAPSPAEPAPPESPGLALMGGPVDSESPFVELRLRGPVHLQEGTLFSVNAPEAESVMIAGEFNDWRPEPMARAGESEAIWESTKKLDGGVYRYKFIINGQWLNDPHNEATMPNPFGGNDSVITVQP